MTTLTDSALDNRVLRVLGDKTGHKKKSAGTLDHRDKILRGYPFVAFESVLREIDLSQKQLSEIMGMTESTLAWMKQPNDVLEGEIPRSLLKTEIGANLVSDELFRIMFGIYI